MKILCPKCNEVIDKEDPSVYVEGEPDFISCQNCKYIISLQYDQCQEADPRLPATIKPKTPEKVEPTLPIDTEKPGHCRNCGKKLGFWSGAVKGELFCKECMGIQRQSVLSEYQQGTLPVVNEPSLLLKREEVCYLQETATLHEEVRVRKGRAGGFTFRIAKGVYYHAGRHATEPTPEIREVDSGALFITSKRVCFTGERKSLSVVLGKIMGVTGYTDGRFQVNWEGRSKPGIFSVEDMETTLAILAGAIKNQQDV